jgi:EAL and modified HD-GYP domain-containing signal transduction protein
MLMYLGAMNSGGLLRWPPFQIGRSGISELYHLSMVRGKFCELMPKNK